VFDVCRGWVVVVKVVGFVLVLIAVGVVVMVVVLVWSLVVSV
jgi:uncharacterized membrane protein